MSSDETDRQDMMQDRAVAEAVEDVLDERSIQAYQIRAWQIAEDHGFHAQTMHLGESFSRPTSPMERCMLIVSEVAEAMEELRHTGMDVNDLPEILYDEKMKPIGFAVEIADAFIRILDLCEEYDIDLEWVTRIKMKYNESRPRMHGKAI